MALGLYSTCVLFLLLGRVAGQSVDVLIDDGFSYSSTSRSGIQYFPTESSWLQATPTNIETRYNGTVHITTATSTRFMHFFQGEEIYYYGDTGPGYGRVGINIDGEIDLYDMVNASTPNIQYQQLLWSRKGLSLGDHQIIVSKDNTVGAGRVSLDFLRIVSSNHTVVPVLSGPGASLVPNEALIVDNTENGVTYSGDWELVESSTGAISDPNSGFYMNSVHRTTIPNAAATFTFNGTAVWYFSDIDYTHGPVQVRVDGGAGELVNGFHQPILSQRLLWSKTDLQAGQHSVTITHMGATGQYATVDFFRYLASNVTTSSSGTPSQSVQNRRPARTARTAAIIAGAVGGLIGLGALIFGAFLVYRRRKQWASHVPKKFDWDMRPAPEMADAIEPYEATPFIVNEREPQSSVTTTTHTQSGYSKPPQGYVSAYSYSGISSSTALGSYTSAGTSNYGSSHYDLPPSYQ